jgi:4-amino-4-deoxy-L-arabinose transferase-like glycosyltransferase
VEKTSVPLLIAAIPVFFLCLGANAIWDANEAFYVETPRQMVLSGDYVNPSFNGLPRFNKPVLSYWIVATLYNLFGVSVAVERVGIALGAMGILLATFLIGRAWRSTGTGVLAALIVAVAPRVVMFSRRIFIDVWITCFMALALACFVLAERHPDQRRRWLTFMYLAIGLGVMTKGPIAIVLPAMVCGLWLVLERRIGDVRRLMLVPGVLIVLAIVLPREVVVYAEHGWSRIHDFWITENFGRYTSEMVPGERGWAFYLPVLFGDLLPWAPLLVIPIASAWRGRRGDETRESAGIRRLLWLWVVTIVLFFTVSQSKQDLYIFPVVPAVAVLIADLLIRTDFGVRHAGVRVLMAIVGAIVLVAAVGFRLLFHSGYYAVADVTLVSVVLAASAAGALALLIRGRGSLAFAVLTAGAIAFNYLFVCRILPDAERLKPIPPIAATFKARASSGASLHSFNMMLPSLVYYADRPVLDDIPSDDYAAALLHGTDEVWIVTGAPEWDRIRAQAPEPVACVAERRHLFVFEAKLSDVVAGRPPAEVLLVTNKCAR